MAGMPSSVCLALGTFGLRSGRLVNVLFLGPPSLVTLSTLSSQKASLSRHLESVMTNRSPSERMS